MDLEAELTRNSFLPQLVHLVFEKYKRTEGISLTKEERAELYSQLTALLGEELLARALRLLDEWAITIYYTKDRVRSIAELCSKRNKLHIVRILPDLNYCKCPYFLRCVLQLKEVELPADTQASTTQTDPINYNNISFTCEHVLALRLHKLLQLKPREQILTAEQFKYFHCDIFAN